MNHNKNFIYTQYLSDKYQDIIISEHAKDEMSNSGITEEEVEACLEHGELTLEQAVKGEMRYGKKIQLKDKKIIVIYNHRNNRIRVITAYPIWRKEWLKKN